VPTKDIAIGMEIDWMETRVWNLFME
jgi:hypothetical protein